MLLHSIELFESIQINLLCYCATEIELMRLAVWFQCREQMCLTKWTQSLNQEWGFYWLLCRLCGWNWQKPDTDIQTGFTPTFDITTTKYELRPELSLNHLVWALNGPVRNRFSGWPALNLSSELLIYTSWSVLWKSFAFLKEKVEPCSWVQLYTVRNVGKTSPAEGAHSHRDQQQILLHIIRTF